MICEICDLKVIALVPTEITIELATSFPSYLWMIFRICALDNVKIEHTYIFKFQLYGCLNNGGENIEQFEINESDDGQFYFTLKAANNEIIATSEMYTTKQNCQNGIESVKTNAPNAKIVDNTD